MMFENGKTQHGALVGWMTETTGNRVILKIQSVDRPPPHTEGDVSTFILMMDKNQAVQLGNTLFEMTDQSSPWEVRRKKKRLLDKLLGA